MEITTEILSMLARRNVSLEAHDEEWIAIYFPKDSGLTFRELDGLRGQLLPDLKNSEIWVDHERNEGGRLVISLDAFREHEGESDEQRK